MSIEVRGVCTLLQVVDMPTSVRFYRDVLGFEIVQTTTPREGDQFDWGLLRLDNVEVMLNTPYERDECPLSTGSSAPRHMLVLRVPRRRRRVPSS